MNKEIISYDQARTRFPEAIAALEKPHDDGFTWSRNNLDESDEFWVIDGTLYFVNTLDEMGDAWADGSWGDATDEAFPDGNWDPS